jgi:hypothetical protein
VRAVVRAWVRGCVRSCVRVVVRARGEHGAVPQVGLLLMGLLATVGCGGSEGAAEPADMHPVLDLSEVPACYTLLSTKGAVGCRSPAPGGATAPVALLNSQGDLDRFTQQEPPRRARVVLLPAALLTRDNMLALQRCGACAGVLLADAAAPPAGGFSPAGTLPYCKCGAVPPCGTSRWNPAGAGLLDLRSSARLLRVPRRAPC